MELYVNKFFLKKKEQRFFALYHSSTKADPRYDKINNSLAIELQREIALKFELFTSIVLRQL